MKNGDKLKKLAAALTIASSFALAIAIFFASKLRNNNDGCRRRRSSAGKLSCSPCYLRAEEPKPPQSAFKLVLADNSYSPFKHFAPHPANASSSEESGDLHPYMEEISGLLKEPRVEEALEEEYTEKLEELTRRNSYVWVEKGSQLQELAEVLSKERLFGVDVEHNSFRSFLGFTALIQISTKKEDYLVDAIALHDLMGILRPIFSNPQICKVFHGADSDVLWLQKDFHIYVVNLFDTAKACHVLSKPQTSLAYLLKTYCGVVTNKELRREDWRQRPLPEEMVRYAQKDSHYLLYIARCLFAELKLHDLENSPCLNDKLTCVYEVTGRSNATYLQLFSKVVEAYPGYSAASSMISRYHKDQGHHLSDPSNKKFQDLVRRLCAWRDIMARVHDENLKYVLSDQAIVALAVNAPTEARDILNVISEADAGGDKITSIQSPSALVSCHLEDLCNLFKDDDDGEALLESLEKCLGANGTCPLSAYNYALLSETSLEVVVRSLARNQTRKTSLARKALQELFHKSYQPQFCKSPVYDNCRIYTSDGRFLSFCARRKFDWYLKRNLAKLVDKDPPSIMLLFEPKQRPEDEDNEFSYEKKKNMCVGCGEAERYKRHRIIPLCYIRHFPEHLKSYRYHNIVLLCPDCHQIAHAAGERCKEKIAADYGIPLLTCKPVVDSSSQEKTLDSKLHALGFGSDDRNQESGKLSALYSGSDLNQESGKPFVLDFSSNDRNQEPDKLSALDSGSNDLNQESVELFALDSSSDDRNQEPRKLCASDSNSNDRNQEPRKLCAFDFGSDDRDQEPESHSVQTMDDMNVSSKQCVGHGPHGKQVVESILEENGDEGIREFVQRWREDFVEAIHPRFLPAPWNTKHKLESSL